MFKWVRMTCTFHVQGWVKNPSCLVAPCLPNIPLLASKISEVEDTDSKVMYWMSWYEQYHNKRASGSVVDFPVTIVLAVIERNHNHGSLPASTELYWFQFANRVKMPQLHLPSFAPHIDFEMLWVGRYPVWLHQKPNTSILVVEQASPVAELNQHWWEVVSENSVIDMALTMYDIRKGSS